MRLSGIERVTERHLTRRRSQRRGKSAKDWCWYSRTMTAKRRIGSISFFGEYHGPSMKMAECEDKVRKGLGVVKLRIAVFAKMHGKSRQKAGDSLSMWRVFSGLEMAHRSP